MSLSSINITGTVSKAAEQRYTPNNASVISFTMTVARFDNKAKELKSYPVKVNVWGDSASPLVEKLKEGTRVFVSGRLQLNQFQDRNGKNIRVAEIEASTVNTIDELNLEVVSNSVENAAMSAAPLATEATNAPSEEIPF